MGFQAGVDYDVVLGELGLLTVAGTLRRFDTTPFSPQVRSSDPRYNNFSLSQFWVIKGWQHGRGALEWEDPLAFYDSTGVDTRIRNQLILAPLQNQTLKTGSVSVGNPAAVFRLITSSANLFCATTGTGRDVYQWNNGTSLWNAETAGLTSDPQDMAEFQADIYVTNGSSNMRRKHLGSWGDGAVAADYLITFGNQVLYRAYGTNQIAYTTTANATSADWVGPIYVGDNNTPIRGLAVGDGRLYIGKDDGLYFLQEGRVFQLLDFSWIRDSNNFKHMRYWNGALYFPILDGLYRLVGNTSLQAVGPDRGAAGAIELGNINLRNPFESDADRATFKSLAAAKTGRIVDLIPTDNFLYAAVDGGSNAALTNQSQILAYNGIGWHQVVEGASSSIRIQSIFFTAQLTSTGQMANPRLWYNYGNDIYNVIMPYGTEDPYDYASSTYGATGTLDTPWFDAGLSDVFKEFLSVKVYSENLTSTETLTVAYEPDDLGTRQSMVDPTGASQDFTNSPLQIINFPPNTIARKLRFRLTLNRGASTTKTPKIKAVVVQYVVRPDAKYAWQVTARTGYRLRNPYSDTAEQADPTEWLQYLTRARDSRQRLYWDDGNIEPGNFGAAFNLVVNPSFRIDSNSDGLADNWNKVSTPTTSLSMVRKIHGLQGQQVVTGATLSQGVETDSITTVVGTRYTASVHLYMAAADPVTLELRDQTGGTVIASTQQAGETDVLGSLAGFVRLEVTGVATSTATRVRVVRNSAGATQATTFVVSAVQLEVTSDKRFSNFSKRASSYVDGDQARCAWMGVPYLSQSTRPNVYNVFVSNISGTEIKRPSILERVRGRGVEQRLVFTVSEVS